MTVKIYKYSNTLSEITSINISMMNTEGMTISHYANSVMDSGEDMPFRLEGVDGHVPYIGDVEFCTVIRKKVNFTAIGVNQKTITDIGKDEGIYKYTDNSPTRPSDLPPGFREVYK